MEQWWVPLQFRASAAKYNPYCVKPTKSMIELLWFEKALHPDNKDHGVNMGPTWVLTAPGGPHVGPMNLANRAEFAFGRTMGCSPMEASSDGICSNNGWAPIRQQFIIYTIEDLFHWHIHSLLGLDGLIEATDYLC